MARKDQIDRDNIGNTPDDMRQDPVETDIDTDMDPMDSPNMDRPMDDDDEMDDMNR